MNPLQLLQPYSLSDLSLGNRIAMAPMTRARAGKERIANALMAEYYAPHSLETDELPGIVADYHGQFSYAAKQLDGFGLAYLHVMDGLAFGSLELGEPMTLAEFREVFTSPLLGNCGYVLEAAEKAIADTEADMIAIGRPHLSSPDLVERFAAGAELNPESDMATWYSPAGARGLHRLPDDGGVGGLRIEGAQKLVLVLPILVLVPLHFEDANEDESNGAGAPLTARPSTSCLPWVRRRDRERAGACRRNSRCRAGRRHHPEGRRADPGPPLFPEARK